MKSRMLMKSTETLFDEMWRVGDVICENLKRFLMCKMKQTSTALG